MKNVPISAEKGGSPRRTFAVPNVSLRAPFVELKDSISSRVDAMSPFLSRLMRLMVTFTAGYSAQADIEVALREALLNAVVHGNKHDPEKRVYVTCRCGLSGEISLAVRDEGRGFDYRRIEGRGICLMRALMDEVSFSDGGSIVHMTKKPPETMSAGIQPLH